MSIFPNHPLRSTFAGGIAMLRPRHSRLILAATVVLSITIWSACNNTNAAQAVVALDSGKIPVTTKSEDARKEFLQGQSLADRLLGQESLQHFDQAIALDPDFASAEMARAASSPTTQDFFDHLKKAV